ncbi:MAG TPA: enoyl-CoA hydratase-related protein [Actinophytocola sp.]|uniref:enoyl-CoA hydratase-related protein n=1 Tax=Actinophytocola sp. TaxID=1872138 RepID=UPI002DDCD0E5|nr:enoyl-CoA hydratase-related protein [Actinophytocola sp.]HEV2781946.1 enoyl-CoA hydratase-related protein [Actinophytocola sp.]
MESYEEITYAVDGKIATVTLNRPRARNGYTLRMADELADAFDRADLDDAVRVVVFTGAGKDFCVGADLSAGSLAVTSGRVDTSDPEWNEPAGRCSMRIFRMSKPVIAALRGAAVGAGSTIILSADYRLAATDARFGFVFSRRGIYPEGASTWFLPRLVGLGRALDWMISGRVFGADEALAAGLVHSLHEPEDLLPRAYELADELIRRTAPVSVAVIRQLLYRMSPVESPFPVQRLDSRLIASCADNPDAVEGVLSFLQKRDPEWTGRVSADQPDFLPWRSG